MLKLLIKQTFELWCKKHWLKIIDKEVNKRNKHYKKYRQHDFVAKQLVKDYNNRYKELVGDK